MNGILLIDKASDWTSHDVVAKLRGLLGQRRIGHAGTLDPMATGLLTIFVGQGTKAVQYAEAAEKSYIARLQLGITTDTQDSTGRVLTRAPRPVSREELEAVLPRFMGDVLQLPPMYSAIKVEGKRLYQLARKGEVVERAPRPVQVRKIDILESYEDGFLLFISCSKGTYIRTLCHDIGQSLGTGGVMASLRRTQVGNFSLDNAYTLEQIAQSDQRAGFLLPLDSLFEDHPALSLTAQEEIRLRQGQKVPVETEVRGTCRVYGPEGEFLALGEIAPTGRPILKTQKNFFTSSESKK